jgi:aspartate kinase
MMQIILNSEIALSNETLILIQILNMKVYKFGGASVKDASGIKNLCEIVSRESSDLVIVVSATDKTTNALEKVLKAWMEGDPYYIEFLDNIQEAHYRISTELFSVKDDAVHLISHAFEFLRDYLKSDKKGDYDFEYDQVVSNGEIWSSVLIFEYLKKRLNGVEFVDIRDCLLTDNRYRDADILWEESVVRTNTLFNFLNHKIYVTQGFIGGTVDGYTSTLGREGSDYTSAVLANMLNADSVTVWKDVPGVLNADPKWMDDALKLDEMSYREAVEMTFSGAKVIHPKTIKPLHNKNIPLHVKSFINPYDPGTVIRADAFIRKVVPVFIKKEDQILISIVPRDFSFVMGDNLSRIFHSFMIQGIKVNLVEASAVSLDVCVNDEVSRIDKLINDLKPEFSIVYNENVEMLTIRHHTTEAVKRITEGREILLEQRTRSTVRYVVRKV